MKKVENKPQKQRFLRFTGYFIIGAVVLMWICRESFGIDTSTLCIFTGLALMNMLLQRTDRKKEKENFLTAEELKKFREESMDTDFSSADEFFKEDFKEDFDNMKK